MATSGAGSGVRRTSKFLKYDKGHMTSVEESCATRAWRSGRYTHLKTSSRRRLPPSDCLRPFSSRKFGEYRLSNLVPPAVEACITPVTNSLAISTVRHITLMVRCIRHVLLLKLYSINTICFQKDLEKQTSMKNKERIIYIWNARCKAIEYTTQVLPSRDSNPDLWKISSALLCTTEHLSH